MSNIRFSIIVPVYNGERHIVKTIYKILDQNFTSFEILVINDGSNDGTQRVLDSTFGSNNQVKLVNTINKGVGSARNTGINMATGEYVLFLDSDDNLTDGALTLLDSCLEKQATDLLIFGYSVFGDKRRENDTLMLEQLKNNVDKNILIRTLLSNKSNLFGYVWRAVYSAKFLKKQDIRFETSLKISEDYLFLLQCILYSNNTLIIPDELYEYHIGESSMSIKYIPTLLDDMMWVNQWIYDNVICFDNSLNDNYQFIVMNTYIRFVQNTLRNDAVSMMIKLHSIKQEKNKFLFKDKINTSIMHLNEFSFRSQIGIVLFKFHMEWLYALLFTFKRKSNLFK